MWDHLPVNATKQEGTARVCANMCCNNLKSSSGVERILQEYNNILIRSCLDIILDHCGSQCNVLVFLMGHWTLVLSIHRNLFFILQEEFLADASSIICTNVWWYIKNIGIRCEINVRSKCNDRNNMYQNRLLMLHHTLRSLRVTYLLLQNNRC